MLHIFLCRLDICILDANVCHFAEMVTEGTGKGGAGGIKSVSSMLYVIVYNISIINVDVQADDKRLFAIGRVL